jgi:hypothetical protein
MVGCATNPMKKSYENWQKVTRTLSSNTSLFKTCKEPYLNKFSEKFVVYTFNIKDTAVNNFSVFNDPYKFEDKLHQCIDKGLKAIPFDVSKDSDFRNGFLMINKDSERFNYILY